MKRSERLRQSGNKERCTVSRYAMKQLMRLIYMPMLFSLPLFLYPQESLFRAEHPVATKIGFQGIGFDLALGNYVSMDVTTWILTTTCNARFYIVEKNASPFIGAGVGSSGGGFGGNGSNDWAVGFIGWEHSYDVVLIQIVFQTPFVKRNEYGLIPFFFNLNLGARLH